MGTFNDSGYFTVKQKGVVVASLDMNFLYEDGCPKLNMPAVWKSAEGRSSGRSGNGRF